MLNLCHRNLFRQKRRKETKIVSGKLFFCSYTGRHIKEGIILDWKIHFKGAQEQKPVTGKLLQPVRVCILGGLRWC